MQHKSVEVNNFDVMRLGLRKELDRLKGKLDESSKSRGGINLALDINGMQELMEMIYKLMDILVSIDYKPTLNIPDIKIPEIRIPDIHVPDIKAPSVYLPAPVVNVESPEVQIDVRGIIQALDNLKYLSDRANKPLSVRMSDGKRFVQAIQNLEKATEQLGVVYAGSSGVTSDDMRNIGLGSARSISDGSKNVTTAGTRVQLITSSTPCRWVIITAKGSNTDTIWVGGSTVAVNSGIPLVGLQSERLDVSDVSNIWLDSEVSGEGVTFVYGN